VLAIVARIIETDFELDWIMANYRGVPAELLQWS
jgi:hypothetical protein